MIHPTFRSSNRLSVQSFKDGGNDPKRDYFDKYYMLSIKIKDFNVLINNKQFFEKPIKSKRFCMKILSKCQEAKTVQQDIC